jgi:hypothetical protein
MPISLSSIGLNTTHNMNVLIHILWIPKVSTQLVELALWEEHDVLINIIDSLPAELPKLERMTLEKLPLSKSDPACRTLGAVDEDCTWTPFTQTVFRTSTPNLQSLILRRFVPVFRPGPSGEPPFANLTSLELELPNLQHASHPARQTLSFLSLTPNLIHLDLNAFSLHEGYMHPEDLDLSQPDAPEPAPYVAMPDLVSAELTGNVIAMTQIVSRMCVPPTARVAIDTDYDCPIEELEEMLDILKGCPMLGGDSETEGHWQSNSKLIPEVHVDTLTLTSKLNLRTEGRLLTLSFASSDAGNTNNLSISVSQPNDEAMFIEFIEACKVLSLPDLKRILVGTVNEDERADACAACDELAEEEWPTVSDVVDISQDMGHQQVIYVSGA